MIWYDMIWYDMILWYDMISLFRSLFYENNFIIISGRFYSRMKLLLLFLSTFVGEKSVLGACSWCIAFFSVANVDLRILVVLKNLLDYALQNVLFRISQASLCMNKKTVWTYNEIWQFSRQLLKKQEKIFENYFWNLQTHNADSDKCNGHVMCIEVRDKYQKLKHTCFCS